MASKPSEAHQCTALARSYFCCTYLAHHELESLVVIMIIVGIIMIYYYSSTQCRQNQELEQDSFALHEQQLRLQEEAQSLTQRLEVILHDKFQHRKHGFDSDTPIDKTLTFLQGVIGVRP